MHISGPLVVKRGVCRNDHPDTSANVETADGQFVANCGCSEDAIPNAERIVRACNAHDELLAALKGLLADPPGDWNDEAAIESFHQHAVSAAQNAIRKAEGVHD